MSRFKIEKAIYSDNEELQVLSSLPAEGAIRISFTKEPDFFAAANLHGDTVKTYVCREISNQKIVGVFSVAERMTFYNNAFSPILYFSDLRINSQKQGSKVLYSIVRFVTDDILKESSIGQTIVFADNTKMLQLINSLQTRSKNLSILQFHPYGDFTSYMLKFPKIIKTIKKYKIAKATSRDIQNMKDFLFAERKQKNLLPQINLDKLGAGSYLGLTINNFYLAYDNENLVGICGVWDQTDIRQTKIHSYSKSIDRLRPLINFIFKFTNNLTLPKSGTVLKLLNIHSIIIKDNLQDIFRELLNTICAEYYKSHYDYFLIGFDQKDPLNNILKAFKTKRIISGKHFLITNKKITLEIDTKKLFFLETARI